MNTDNILTLGEVKIKITISFSLGNINIFFLSKKIFDNAKRTKKLHNIFLKYMKRNEKLNA